MPKTLTLKVVGEHIMHCAGCERSVTFAISQLPGVDEVRADWKTQAIQINLSLDGELDLEKIKAELDWIGYEVEVV
ncbi:MAG: heavy-metal-associated domain-containing protein [Anaerolineales bacterium]|nr:heavy-metal-associated domain-containing protein [Anaerolineales bacterium]